MYASKTWHKNHSHVAIEIVSKRTNTVVRHTHTQILLYVWDILFYFYSLQLNIVRENQKNNRIVLIYISLKGGCQSGIQ